MLDLSHLPKKFFIGRVNKMLFAANIETLDCGIVKLNIFGLLTFNKSIKRDASKCCMNYKY